MLNNLESPASKIGGTSDHVHILFRMSKNHSLAEVVETIKVSSSKWIKTQNPALHTFHWQNGYGGFSVSPSQMEAVVEYIEQQEEHHRVVSFQEEYRKLLQKCEVEFDETICVGLKVVERPFRASILKSMGRLTQGAALG